MRVFRIWAALFDVVGTLAIGSLVLSYIMGKDYWETVDAFMNQTCGAISVFLAVCRRGI